MWSLHVLREAEQVLLGFLKNLEFRWTCLLLRPRQEEASSWGWMAVPGVLLGAELLPPVLGKPWWVCPWLLIWCGGPASGVPTPAVHLRPNWLQPSCVWVCCCLVQCGGATGTQSYSLVHQVANVTFTHYTDVNTPYLKLEICMKHKQS